MLKLMDYVEFTVKSKLFPLLKAICCRLSNFWCELNVFSFSENEV